MKLTPAEDNWRVQSLGRQDVNAPMRVANAEANAARAWGRVYEDAGNTASAVLMDIYKRSNEEEAQDLYNDAIGQVNKLENTLYTSQALEMDSEAMDGVNYDDSYTEVEGNELVTKNKGYAPVHEVGAKVWSTQSESIMKNHAAQASNPMVAKILASKLGQQLQAKTQHVGRHVTELAIADRRAGIDLSIKESMRTGDLDGALRISAEAHKRGIINQAKMTKYDYESHQAMDLLRFQQELSVTESEQGLAKLSDVVLFSDSYMSPSQKASASNNTLQKIRQKRQDAKDALGEWQDDNEVFALIKYHKGEMTVDELLNNSHAYDRAGFSRMYERFIKPVPKVSDADITHDYDIAIGDVNFNSNPQYPAEEQSKDILNNMWNSVKKGSLTVEDFQTKRDTMEKQAQIPFKTQPYGQAKMAVFTDILGTIDAGSMAEIMSAGVNLPAVMRKKYGQGDNTSVLAMRAFEDLNQYVRTYGHRADPIEWWDKNRDKYKVDVAQKEGHDRFSNIYANDAIQLSNGKLDVKSTEDNIVRSYNNGEYGIPGSTQAMEELNRRALILKGVRPEEIMK